MTDSTIDHTSSGADIARSTDYAPYAQLVKMLVPSSGCIAVYDVDGDLIWCSDGYERPDLRELVEELTATASDAEIDQGAIRRTSTGISAFTAILRNERRAPIGSVLIELARNEATPGGGLMAPSLLRPVLECLQSRISLEQAVLPPADTPEQELELLLSVDDTDNEGPSALQRLVAHCVENLGCVGGAFVIPETNLAVVATAGEKESDVTAHFLDRTQKHLLAWAQLNNRPMVVNRVGDQQNVAPYKILSCPVRDPQSRVTGLLALFRAADADDFEFRDVRILEFMSRKAVSILNSQHDRLTGLINRLTFEQRVQKSLDTSQQNESSALLYVDIDRLQLINDAFGFRAGDEVIRRLGEVIRNNMADNDLASRIGGDRFAIFLCGDERARAEALAESIVLSMSQLGYLNGSDAVPVSVSVGLVSPGSGQQNFQHVLAVAELACKRAQQEGGGRLETSSDDDSDALNRRAELFASASLQHALKNNEFRLEAQAIVGVAEDSGSVLGLEILVRMRDQAGGLVAPDKFVDAAERYGLMPALDRWVVSAAFKVLQNATPTLAELPLGVSINVSAQSLVSGSFPRFVVEELKRTGLPPELFCFEIKESAALNHLSEAEQFIDALDQAGCCVALDDFGCGLSSLAQLKRLKVRYLKIDGKLVRNVLDDLHVESMLRGLSLAAQTLGVRTVAEHVESEPIALKILELEVDFGQGYYFGHPQTLARAIEEALDSIAAIPAAAT